MSLARLGVLLIAMGGTPAAAAQFMWEQIASTDFDARVDLLDAEPHIAEIFPLFPIWVWRLPKVPPHEPGLVRGVRRAP